MSLSRALPPRGRRLPLRVTHRSKLPHRRAVALEPRRGVLLREPLLKDERPPPLRRFFARLPRPPRRQRDRLPDDDERRRLQLALEHRVRELAERGEHAPLPRRRPALHRHRGRLRRKPGRDQLMSGWSSKASDGVERRRGR
eukprot:25903-Pelagococcus_subviridis.AAC.4